MSLIKFSDWRAKFFESSPLTRQRDQWGRYGNYPLRADYMSRSTPLPAFVDKLKKELGTPQHPKRKHKHKHKKLHEAKKSVTMHTDMDAWLKEIEELKKDLAELSKVKEKSTLDAKKRSLELARKKRDVFSGKEEPKEKPKDESKEPQKEDQLDDGKKSQEKKPPKFKNKKSKYFLYCIIFL